MTKIICLSKYIRQVTSGIFYCRNSVDLSVSASNKLSCNLTGKYFEVGNKNIPPNRWRSFKKQSAKQEYLDRIKKYGKRILVHKRI